MERNKQEAEATLRGVYKKGTVHLHELAALPDDTEVEVLLRPVATPAKLQSERDRIHALFLEDGMVNPRSQTDALPPLSPEHEAKLAEKLARAGSLSDVITQERDE